MRIRGSAWVRIQCLPLNGFGLKGTKIILKKPSVRTSKPLICTLKICKMFLACWSKCRSTRLTWSDFFQHKNCLKGDLRKKRKNITIGYVLLIRANLQGLGSDLKINQIFKILPTWIRNRIWIRIWSFFGSGSVIKIFGSTSLGGGN